MKKIFLVLVLFYSQQLFAIDLGFYKCLDNEILSGALESDGISDHYFLDVRADRIITHDTNYNFDGVRYVVTETFMITPADSELMDVELTDEEKTDLMTSKKLRLSRISEESMRLDHVVQYSGDPGKETTRSILTRIDSDTFSVESVWTNENGETGSGSSTCKREVALMM